MTAAFSISPATERSSISTESGVVDGSARRIGVLISRMLDMKTRTKMLTSMGATKGIVIRRKVVNEPAPTTRDACSSSPPTCKNAARIICVPRGMSFRIKAKIKTNRVP